MQPVWLCVLSSKPFEDAFENTQWRKVKQKRPMWLLFCSCIHFEGSFVQFWKLITLEDIYNITSVLYRSIDFTFDISKPVISVWNQCYLLSLVNTWFVKWFNPVAPKTCVSDQSSFGRCLQTDHLVAGGISTDNEPLFVCGRGRGVWELARLGWHTGSSQSVVHL